MKRNHIAVIAAALAACSTTFAADNASQSDKGHLWLLSSLSYELPSSSQTTYEVGIGWYGLGGGVNIYSSPNKLGGMISGRVGWFGDAVAANVGYNYVGTLSDSLEWRIGVGVEYLTGTGFLSGNSGVIPIFELGLGIKL